jgi:hypothetical protein
VYLFKGKKLTIGNGLMEQAFGPGIIRQVITGEALNEIFDMSGRHEYHDVWSLQGPVLRKAKDANHEQRSRALVGLDLSIKIRTNQSNDAGHARMCQTLVNCADAIRALNVEDIPRDVLQTQLLGFQGPSEDSQWGTDAAPTDLEPEVQQADVLDSWDDSDDELDDADALELLKSAFVKQDVTGQ